MSATNENNDDRLVEADHNADPITGEHGSHPVGAGLGAAAGAAAGMAAGSVGGPIGAAIGAVVGGVAGGLGGKAFAEQVDPTVEKAYWEKNYRSRDYVDSNFGYEVYEPAYRYGYESRAKSPIDDFTTAEPELQRDWEKQRGESKLDWQSARPATEDAWNRVNEQVANSEKKPK